MLTDSRNQRQEKAKMPEKPEVTVDRMRDGRLHEVVQNVVWFGSLTERNSFFKAGMETFETMHDDRPVFGLRFVSLLD
jgi:hypothetical protein